MIARYQTMTIREVGEAIDPISLLFAWQQGGDEDGPRNLISSQTADDSSLIRTLAALTTSINSSNGGRFDVLRRGNLDSFLNYDEARKRVSAIAAQTEDSEESQMAKRLAAAFKCGDEY
jgi:hypothetical protein